MQNGLNFITAAVILLTGTTFAAGSDETDISSLLSLMESKKVQQTDASEKLEESRQYYVSGEFTKAQQGFEEVIRIDPENAEAGIYLRKLLERDARSTEKIGLDAVRDEWNSGLVLRSYTISPDAAAALGLQDAKDRVAVTSLFPEVTFPEGASAVYHPSTGKIFMSNTPENLTVAEEILTALDVSTRSSDVDQVEIEAKFIEVSEGTLEELGFEWASFDGENIDLDGGWTYDGRYFLFDDALRGGPNGSDMPFSRPNSLGAGEAAASGDWSASRFEDTFNADPANLALQYRNSGTPLDILISALDQSSGTDVLSAPRVVTKSGKTAVIRVGQLHNYPEIYEVGASEGNIVHINYVDFSATLLGVELEVTPLINGDQIELSLNPRIRELLGWQNYMVAPADSSYTYYQYRLGMEFDHDPIVARLPVYKEREIQTEVTIADGSTIGMGGLITEKIESFNDRVPVLGSIPMLGRLFRNEGERAVKRNMIMFVTARKIDANGQVNTERSFE